MKTVILGLLALLSFNALGIEEEIDLSQTALTCTKNIASAQNVWDVGLKKEFFHSSFLYPHRFTRWWVYEDGAHPEVCDLVKSLQGQTVKVQIVASRRDATLSTCVEGGTYYCKRWACFLYRNEFATLEFPQGLLLRSSYYDQSPKKIGDGQCS